MFTFNEVALLLKINNNRPIGLNLLLFYITFDSICQLISVCGPKEPCKKLTLKSRPACLMGFLFSIIVDSVQSPRSIRGRVLEGTVCGHMW